MSSRKVGEKSMQSDCSVILLDLVTIQDSTGAKSWQCINITSSVAAHKSQVGVNAFFSAKEENFELLASVDVRESFYKNHTYVVVNKKDIYRIFNAGNSRFSGHIRLNLTGEKDKSKISAIKTALSIT